jgi:dihydroneopterin triphosphate diphosphatase
MARAPFQILGFPYRISATGEPEYAVLRRADLPAWQGIAGGGEGDESAVAAARREAFEEAGIPTTAPLVPLKAIGRIAVEHFHDRGHWDPALDEIPEYSFGIDCQGVTDLHLSSEHTEYAWLTYSDAVNRLEWESNRIALRELHALLLAEADITNVQLSERA